MVSDVDFLSGDLGLGFGRGAWKAGRGFWAMRRSNWSADVSGDFGRKGVMVVVVGCKLGGLVGEFGEVGSGKGGSGNLSLGEGGIAWGPLGDDFFGVVDLGESSSGGGCTFGGSTFADGGFGEGAF